MKIYVLHGEEAVKLFDSEGAAAVKEKGQAFVDVYELTPDKTIESFIDQMLNNLSGWNDFRRISEADYKIMAELENETVDTLEVSVITGIVVENLFEEIYKQLNIGVIATHENIASFALKFYKQHRHIQDWETYCDQTGNEDWETYLLKSAREEFKN